MPSVGTVCFECLQNYIFLRPPVLTFLRVISIPHDIHFVYDYSLKCSKVHAPCSVEVAREHANALGTD